MQDVRVPASRVLTIPNMITSARITLIPIFAWLFLTGRQDVPALVILLTIGSTDWVDGFVARKTGQVSELGKVLDPIADRAAILTVLAVFTFRGTVNPYVAGVILLRDVLVSIAFPMLEARGVPRVPVNRVGKAATAAIYLGMGLAAIGLVSTGVRSRLAANLSFWLLTGGAALYWGATVMYVRAITQGLKGSRANR